MSSFFDLVGKLQTSIDTLDEILSGADTETVFVNGVNKNTISKAIKDQFAAIQAMVQGRLAFETKALMDADTTQLVNVLAHVWNDPIADNNKIYGWNGSTWIASKYDDISAIITDIQSIKAQQDRFKDVSMGAAGLFQYLKSEDEQLTPVIIDENNQVVLQFDNNTGEMVAPGLDRMDSLKQRNVPVVVDDAGNIAILVEKDTGRVLMDPHDSTIALGLSRIGIFEQHVSDYAFALVDEEQRIALAVDHAGNVVLGKETVLGNRSREVLISKQSADSDINHFIFSGQSLSVGAAGLPIISTSQPYDNITFIGGPRSDLDELASFKPLVEDDNLAPDGGANRGETVCSGAANFISELLYKENDLFYTAHSYDILASTVGHGGYRIDQLNKNSAWYDYLTAHVQAGFDLSQAQNKSFSVQAIGWIQGENDQFDGSKARLAYKTDLIQYQADIQTDVQSITSQNHRVPLLTYQLACYVNNGGNYRNVTLAQLDAAEENSNIYLVTPMYHLPYADGVHLTAVGYKWLGHYFGKAYKRIVYEGVEWQPLSPKSIIAQGKVITVEMHVPEPPLILDDVSLLPTQDYGFVVEDATGVLTIISVEVSGPTRLKIVVDRDLTAAPVLRYGLDHLADGLTHSFGGSGNLRDSDALIFQHQSKAYPLYNWCVMFDKSIF